MRISRGRGQNERERGLRKEAEREQDGKRKGRNDGGWMREGGGDKDSGGKGVENMDM